MATPSSGAISMNNFRTEITRATGSSISMNEVRTRYGSTGAISFSQLYKVEGFTASPANYAVFNKYVDTNLDGWSYREFAFGSVSPNEASGIQVAANSFIVSMNSPGGASAGGELALYDSSSGISGNSSTITSGFQGTNISRIVTANTSRSITGSSAVSIYYTYDWPTTGTIHCLVQF
jgi:hypothetical protein